jgi:hypothetical protein
MVAPMAAKSPDARQLPGLGPPCYRFGLDAEHGCHLSGREQSLGLQLTCGHAKGLSSPDPRTFRRPSPEGTRRRHELSCTPKPDSPLTTTNPIKRFSLLRFDFVLMSWLPGWASVSRTCPAISWRPVCRTAWTAGPLPTWTPTSVPGPGRSAPLCFSSRMRGPSTSTTDRTASPGGSAHPGRPARRHRTKRWLTAGRVLRSVRNESWMLACNCRSVVLVGL